MDLNLSLFCVIFCLLGRIQAIDNFGLLYGTLKTFQAHACDNEELRLNCSSNSIITINFVRYGRQEHSGHLCPGFNSDYSKSCNLDSALKVIEEKCRGQMLCRMLISPEMFSEDPCPGVRKYAEVAYKCRPERFRNKIACDGETMNLSCPAGQRITIYAATFGTSSSDVIECPQPDNVQSEDCHVSYAAETVMRRCSYLEECSLEADIETFGNPNCVGRKYLKVTYNCVEKKLLMLPSDRRNAAENIITTSYPAWVRGMDHSVQDNRRPHGYVAIDSTRSSNTYKSEMQSDEVPVDSQSRNQQGNQQVVGFISEWMSAHKYVSGNKDKLILYVTVSLSVGFLLFVTVLIVRLIVRRTGAMKNSKLDITPQTDDPFFSDSDLEQYDPAENLPVPVINYTASLRRQSSDVQPRAPVTTGTEANHYFS